MHARVSGDDPDKERRNLLGQLDMCRAHAQERDHQIVAELREADQGASGAELEVPQLTHIRDLARAKALDDLVPRKLDRLSRNLAK